MTDKEILDSFQSNKCPACDGYKQPRKSHCRVCYFKLPPEKRQALYQKFYEGYQEAFRDSLEFLKAS